MPVTITIAKEGKLLIVPKPCITLLLSPLKKCLQELILATSMHVKRSHDYIIFGNVETVCKPNETHLVQCNWLCKKKTKIATRVKQTHTADVIMSNLFLSFFDSFFFGCSRSPSEFLGHR